MYAMNSIGGNVKIEVYCLCFMCAVQCLIKITVEEDRISLIEANSHISGMERSIYLQGGEGTVIADDQELLRTIRSGCATPHDPQRTSWLGKVAMGDPMHQGFSGSGQEPGRQCRRG